MKKIFLIYGHYDNKSFNAAIRDTFTKTAKEKGHLVDTVDLYKEKFDPVFSGGEPGADVLDHRKRIDNARNWALWASSRIGDLETLRYSKQLLSHTALTLKMEAAGRLKVKKYYVCPFYNARNFEQNL